MPVINKSNFKIEKLYLDCIDEQGNCFIIYWIKIHFHILRIFYSGFIFSDRDGTISEKSVLRKSESSINKESLYFNQENLKIAGRWNRSDDPIILSLYKDDDGNELIWNCHHPKSLTEIIFNGKVYKGFGYAETLSLPIKPWNLPVDELRWGRFLSDAYTVVWMNWRWKYPVNRIFLNNTEFNDVIFYDNKISFGDGMYQLMFSDIITIRKGKLLNLFSGIPLLRFMFNRRILNTMEIKYKAKTVLSNNAVILSNGWSLFEIVTWAK